MSSIYQFIFVSMYYAYIFSFFPKKCIQCPSSDYFPPLLYGYNFLLSNKSLKSLRQILSCPNNFSQMPVKHGRSKLSILIFVVLFRTKFLAVWNYLLCSSGTLKTDPATIAGRKERKFQRISTVLMGIDSADLS